MQPEQDQRRLTSAATASGANPCGQLVPRQISFVTSCRARVGRVTPCAPRSADSFPNGAHGVTRPTTSRNLFVTVPSSHRLKGWHCFVPSSLLNSDDSQGG